MFAQPAGASLGLACAAGTSLQDFERTGGKLTGFMDVRSGDPAADCAAEYKRLEGAAPPLLRTAPAVPTCRSSPRTWPVPPQWEPFGSGFRNDATRLELRQRLGDVLDGPEAQCRSADAVQDIVERDLDELLQPRRLIPARHPGDPRAD